MLRAMIPANDNEPSVACAPLFEPALRPLWTTLVLCLLDTGCLT